MPAHTTSIALLQALLLPAGLGAWIGVAWRWLEQRRLDWFIVALLLLGLPLCVFGATGWPLLPWNWNECAPHCSL